MVLLHLYRTLVYATVSICSYCHLEWRSGVTNLPNLYSNCNAALVGVLDSRCGLIMGRVGMYNIVALVILKLHCTKQLIKTPICTRIAQNQKTDSSVLRSDCCMAFYYCSVQY
jgi:hypothetical protein